MFKGREVIVTGGAGFIGGSTVRRLVGEGAHVRVIDNLWRGSLENLRGEDGDPVIDLDRDFTLADLTDPSECMRLLKDADLVYHLADVVGGVHFAFGEEDFVFRQNVLINTCTLAACVANRIPDYVYVGTACSYPKTLQMQDGVVALREDQTYPAEPESGYGWSKLMGEYEAELAKKMGKINVGLLRLHNVYGPRASYDPRTSQVLPSLIRKAVLYPAEPYVVWGSGNQYRDFIYVDDVVEALLLMAEKGMNQGLIQVGSERATSIREAAQLIAEISGKGMTPSFDAEKPEGDRGRIAVCDRARRILSWRCGVDFRTGLAHTYRWIEESMRRDEAKVKAGA